MADVASAGGVLCILIPAHNEQETIGSVIDGIPSRIDGIAKIRIIVIDDGSMDATASIARERGAGVVRHPVRSGVGRAFQTGVEAALAERADIIVNIDADGQFDPSHVPLLVAPVLQCEADMVTCSRFKDPALIPRMPFAKRFGNRMMALIISLLTRRRYHDVACGFRAFSREAALRMNLFGEFTYTQETFLDLVFKGMTIKEVPLAVKGVREHGESRVAHSIFRYALRAGTIVLSAFRDHRPLAFFGAQAAALFVPGAALAAFFILHYSRTGSFSPHLWAGFVSAGLLAFSTIFLLVGLFMEAQRRIRLTLERLLYRLKRLDVGWP